MTPGRTVFVLSAFLTAAACATGRGTPAVPAPSPAVLATPAPSPSSAPRPALARDIHWVRDSAEYRAAVTQTYRFAAQQVERSAEGKPARGWAVILDADETVLDNSQYQKELGGQPYSSATWAQWVRRRAAGTVPGVPAFLAHVRRLGGRVVIVTNRTESLCEDTRENLRALSLTVDLVLCRPDAGSSDKNARFEAVARGTASAELPPLEVLAFVGDNIQDFPGLRQDLRKAPEEALADFGRRYFVLPNPMYGSWEQNPAR
jgi:5'-nucleotidase (lipoprotein e(P4) family)